MSAACCFSATPMTPSYDYYAPSAGRPGRRPWRWWRAKCAGIAAAVGSRIRRSVKRIHGRRRTRRRAASSALRGSSSAAATRHHHDSRRSFAPVYVDELYNHHQQQPPPKPHRVVRAEEPTDAATNKLTAAAPPLHAAAARAPCSKAATVRVDAAVASRVHSLVGAATAGCGGAGSGNQRQALVAAAAVGGAMRNVLLRSPGRGGGGVLGAVKGMGEVDLRAELFIRKFKEDMRLQSQRSAEEFQAMLARGL